jgi:tetratricopeptide (TPR) repeat protein
MKKTTTLLLTVMLTVSPVFAQFESSTDPAGSVAGSQPELAPVEKARAQAQQLFKKGNLAQARAELQKAIKSVDPIQEDVKNKMFAKTPGYDLNRYHAGFLEKAALYKDLADVQYKEGNLQAVQQAYEQILQNKDMGGVRLEDRLGDIAYLVMLCDASGDRDKGELYYIHLLKAQRLKAGDEASADVLQTFDKFAKYMRKTNKADKAASLEARANAVKSATKPYPKLWFSF